jgi:hypothetical protein
VGEDGREGKRCRPEKNKRRRPGLAHRGRNERTFAVFFLGTVAGAAQKREEGDVVDFLIVPFFFYFWLMCDARLQQQEPSARRLPQERATEVDRLTVIK